LPEEKVKKNSRIDYLIGKVGTNRMERKRKKKKVPIPGQNVVFRKKEVPEGRRYVYFRKERYAQGVKNAINGKGGGKMAVLVAGREKKRTEPVEPGWGKR